MESFLGQQRHNEPLFTGAGCVLSRGVMNCTVCTHVLQSEIESVNDAPTHFPFLFFI